MTKKETAGTMRDNAEDVAKVTDQESGSVSANEQEIKTESGEETKTTEEKAADNDSGTGKDEKVTGVEKRKKHTKEKELELKLKEQHDKYLRLSAEFDNYRKRMMKERIEITQFAGSELITKILPVIDDLERAMVSMKSTQEIDAVRQGVDLIYNKFKDYLTQQGVKEIDALHKEFNTDYHEAITKYPVTDNEMKGKVIEVIDKGYTLNDRIIRYSRVVVGE